MADPGKVVFLGDVSVSIIAVQRHLVIWMPGKERIGRANRGEPHAHAGAKFDDARVLAREAQTTHGRFSGWPVLVP